MAKATIRDVAERVYDFRIDSCGHAELFHAIEHGMRSDDIADPTLAALWVNLEDAFDVFVALKPDICNILHDAFCPTKEHLLP